MQIEFKEERVDGADGAARVWREKGPCIGRRPPPCDLGWDDQLEDLSLLHC